MKQLWDLGLVDRFWIEIVGKVKEIEALSEEPSFPSRTLAAAIASKCYYHLEEYKSALRLALGAGSYFDVEAKNEYVDKMVAECIDRYTARRQEAAIAEGGVVGASGAGAAAGAAGAGAEDDDIDLGAMESIVNRMFDRCFSDHAYTQAAGIALEAGRLDIVEASILRSGDVAGMLSFVYETSVALVKSKEFRTEVLNVLVKLYRSVHDADGTVDYMSMCRCLQFLDESDEVATLLSGLIRSSCAAGSIEGATGAADADVVAYQVAFDLGDNDNQQFMIRVDKALPRPPKPPAEPTDEDKKDVKGDDDKGEGEAGGDVGMSATDASGAGGGDSGASEESPEFWERIGRLRSIVMGTMTTNIYLDFLYRNNTTDMVLLQQMMAAVEGRGALLHNALVVCHAYMASGTTNDRFLLKNLDWLRKAANWARFTATAGQGVVHKGHLKEAMRVLEPYLPRVSPPQMVHACVRVHVCVHVCVRSCVHAAPPSCACTCACTCACSVAGTAGPTTVPPRSTPTAGGTA